MWHAQIEGKLLQIAGSRRWVLIFFGQMASWGEEKILQLIIFPSYVSLSWMNLLYICSIHNHREMCTSKQAVFRSWGQFRLKLINQKCSRNPVFWQFMRKINRLQTLTLTKAAEGFLVCSQQGVNEIDSKARKEEIKEYV